MSTIKEILMLAEVLSMMESLSFEVRFEAGLIGFRAASALVPRDGYGVNQAKAILKARGWTYRTAGPHLGVSHPHLSEVLNGHRQSKRLLAAIATIPIAPPKPSRKSTKGAQ